MYRLLPYAMLVGLFLALPFGQVVAHTGTTHSILMTESGFEPDTVEILQGDIVLFVNKDVAERWPASNIHPTHTVYPGSDIKKCSTSDTGALFDACRGLATGETFSFVFTEVGRWRFHDHLVPRHTGEIIVREDPDFVVQNAPESEGSSFLVRIYEGMKGFFARVYRAVFKRDVAAYLTDVRIFDIAHDDEKLTEAVTIAGPREVMDALLEEAGGGREIDCHQEAHQIGRISYTVFGAAVFEEGDPSCHSGFYHGAMEAFLAEKGTADLAENIENLCSTFDTSFGVFECIHGVGHGVMAYEDYDLLVSLDVCDELKDTFSSRSCYGGVFMENIVAAQGLGAVPGHETEWVRDSDPHYPCSLFEPGSHREFDCYQMQTSWMLSLENFDFPAVLQQCLAARESAREACFISFGRDAAGFSLRDPHEILAICDDVPRERGYYSNCLYGGLNVIIDFWGSKLEHQGDEFCSLVEEEAMRADCYKTLEARKAGIFGA